MLVYQRVDNLEIWKPSGKTSSIPSWKEYLFGIFFWTVQETKRPRRRLTAGRVRRQQPRSPKSRPGCLSDNKIPHPQDMMITNDYSGVS